MTQTKKSKTLKSNSKRSPVKKKIRDEINISEDNLDDKDVIN